MIIDRKIEIKDIVDELPKNPKKKPRYRTLNKIKNIVIHCTASDTWTPYDVAKYDVGPNHISSSGLATITYHYMVMADGTIYKTCDERIITAHVGKWNTKSLGIALQYSGSNVISPSSAMLINAAKLVYYMIKGNGRPYNILLHRELPSTGWLDLNDNNKFDGTQELRKVCPGMLVDGDKFRALVGLYGIDDGIVQESIEHSNSFLKEIGVKT